MSANDKADAAWEDYINQQQEEEVQKLQERIKQLEELGNELRECASMIGTHYSNQIETIDQAEAAVEAWDKFNKETKQ